jgi:hypothetical protein
MKDAVLTIRVPAATRRRLAALARQERRSLSAQAERLIEQGLSRPVVARASRSGVRSLAGLLRGGAVPTLTEFRAVRATFSAALARRTRARDERRR